MSTQRRRLLMELIALDRPIDEIRGELATLPWDSEEELVVLDRLSIARVLQRYIDDGVTADELITWANAIEGRDDIGFAPSDAAAIKAFLFEAANPEISKPIDHDRAQLWLEVLHVKRS